MVEIFNPATTSTKGLSEFAPDSTAGRKLVFYHASEGKPLATPWQVALTRSKLLTELNLPEGYILDCACGSGIQLGAHMAILQRPGIGVELDPLRAQASAVNLQSIATYRNETDAERMQQTRIFASDGRDGAVVCAALADHFSLDTFPNIALLHLDPARPRNSRTHGLEEMAPRLDEVFNGWAPYLSEGLHGPAMILDLSPRLTHEQRLEVESLVDAVWKDIAQTWVWTSRGRGRVDRLALWLGDAATKGIARRFVPFKRIVLNGTLSAAGEGFAGKPASCARYLFSKPRFSAPRSTCQLPSISSIGNRVAVKSVMRQPGENCFIA